MDIMLKRIFELIGKKRGAQKELAEYLNISNNTITDWKSGRVKSYRQLAPQIAEHYGVSLDWLSGLTDDIEPKEKPLAIGEELSGMTLVKFPVIGTIAAGYNCCALEEYTGDYAYFPSDDLSAPAEEYFVLRIKGDSMYPKLLENDCVLVRRKPCVENGKIAVVIYDGEEATAKIIKYSQDRNWLELIPINPEYQPKRIEGVALEQCCILGEIVKLQRDL